MRCRRFLRHNGGATAVEFALTFPILLLVTFGVLEFGRAVFIWDSLKEALSITGRYAMYNPSATNSQLQTYFGQNIHAISGSAVSLSFASSSTGTMPFTTITATYNFVPMTSLIPSLTFPLTSSARVPRI